MIKFVKGLKCNPHSKLKKICFRAQCHLSYDTLIIIVLSRLTEIIPFKGKLMGGAMFVQREPN